MSIMNTVGWAAERPTHNGNGSEVPITRGAKVIRGSSASSSSAASEPRESGPMACGRSARPMGCFGALSNRRSRIGGPRAQLAHGTFGMFSPWCASYGHRTLLMIDRDCPSNLETSLKLLHRRLTCAVGVVPLWIPDTAYRVDALGTQARLITDTTR